MDISAEICLRGLAAPSFAKLSNEVIYIQRDRGCNNLFTPIAKSAGDFVGILYILV
jgi:hypothetical protein